MAKPVNQDLWQYIEENILPQYDAFDKAHRQDHARTVIRQSMEMAERLDVNADMVYAIAAYHDTGLCEGREHHHEASARIVRADQKLREWFTEELKALGGYKEEAKNFEIGTEAELLAFADYVNSNRAANGVLTADIALSNTWQTPIGIDGAPFTGTFDGQGHKISGNLQGKGTKDGQQSRQFHTGTGLWDKCMGNHQSDQNRTK